VLDFTTQRKEENEELIKKKLKEQKIADKRSVEEVRDYPYYFYLSLSISFFDLLLRLFGM